MRNSGISLLPLNGWSPLKTPTWLMTGLERRLGRLEAAAGVMGKWPVVFVRFVDADGSEPPTETVTVNGCVWHRAKGETETVFLDRVRAEARPIHPGCGVVGFLA